MSKINFLGLIVLLFTFCTFLNCSPKTNFESETVETDEEVFPKKGMQIAENEIEKVVFSWKLETKGGRKKPVQQTMNLYRLDSINQSGPFKHAYFRLIEKKKVDGGTSRIAGPTLGRKLQKNTLYMWEVVDDKDQEIIPKTAFTAGTANPISTSLLEEEVCLKCTENLANDCLNLVCTEYPCDEIKIHIVTEPRFDIYGGGIRLVDEAIDTLSNGRPCFRPAFNGQLSASFTIEVPCDKIDIIETSLFQTFLFRNGMKIDPQEDPLTIHYSLNWGQESLTELSVTADDYLPPCITKAIDPTCKATIQMHLSYTNQKAVAKSDFSLVFYLPEDANHSHDVIIVNEPEDGETDDQARKQNQPVTHTHNSEIPDDCADIDKNSLDYYLCLDSKSDEHISQHVVVIDLLSCEEQ